MKRGSLASVLFVLALAACSPAASDAQGDGETRIVAAGDIASCATSGDEATANIVDQEAPDAVLALGDNVYESGTHEEFEDCYEPSWGRFKDITYPAPGNHDYGNGGYEDRSKNSYNADAYHQYFGRYEKWYSFELDGWKIISLDSDCFMVDCSPQGAQFEWLQKELEADDADCTIAYWHHPVYAGAGHHDGEYKMRPMLRLLHREGADVILNGHDHVYDSRHPVDAYDNAEENGVRQFVVGTGGKSVHDFGNDPNTRVRLAELGVLTMTLEEGYYSWRFTNVAGQVRDTGEADCR